MKMKRIIFFVLVLLALPFGVRGQSANDLPLAKLDAIEANQ